MKVAIIGAGVSGLLSLKYALESDIECDCFEETGTFGGTWVYTPETNSDKNGLPIYRSMYKNLVTNVPKELMTFSNFPYPQNLNYSFITSSEVLNYLTEYVQHFSLEKHIKYYTTVTKVEPDGEKWMVTTENLITKMSNSKLYDYVLVCSGHFRSPIIPVIPGQNLYKGLQMHSRDYRKPKFCENKRVLIIGAGFSGTDIAQQIVGFARSVLLSHRAPTTMIIEHVLNKPSVTEFQKNDIVFSDGSKESIDVVIYGTGYEYKFPFLTDKCGVTTVDNWVRALYKHVVNIQHPTMMFIGIPYLAAPFMVADVQAQFAVALIKKVFSLPSKEHMHNELENYVVNVKNKIGNQNHLHKFGFYQREYLLDLVKTANLRPIPPVLHDLFDYWLSHKDKMAKKKSRFVILDDNVFTEHD